jgi:biopolymer transport protein ExbD
VAFDDDEETMLDQREDGVNAINITPLVDVCLVLVLIFMVTSPFFARQLMTVALPRASAAETEDRENITVSMSLKEGFAVNEVSVPRENLYAELKRQLNVSGFSFVLIRADQTVAYGEVEEVMKLCKKAKVKRIAFATDPRF